MQTQRHAFPALLVLAAALAASPALADAPMATSFSGITVAELSQGQIATAASQACIPNTAPPLGRSLRLGDLNGDDKADLLLTRTDGAVRATARTWQYYPMDGTSQLTGDGTAALKTDLDWIVMGLGDFDGDGKTDVMTRHATTGAWHLARMDGKTVLTAGTGVATTLTTITKWRLAAIGDFDADTQDDLLLRHTDTGRWLMYEMNGLTASTLGSGIAADLPDDTDLELAGSGDLNGDGKADMVLRHKTTGKWHYYPMNGLAVAAGSGEIGLSLSTDWTLEALPDLDGDGKDDLLVRHTDGTWRWYPMDGKDLQTGDAATDLSTSLDWKLAGYGDLTGDAKDDIVLRDVSTNASNRGRWMVRAMNGATSIAADSGIATSLTRVQAWDVAARDKSSARCPVYTWSCKQSDNLPRNPTLGYMEANYAIIDVSSSATAYEKLYTVHPHASVPVSWAKYAGINGDRVRYLLNGQVALETMLTGAPFTGPQSGSATLNVTQGGKYDVEVALCKKNCCSRTGTKAIVVADTDGSHLDALTWVPKTDTTNARPDNNQAIAYPNPKGHMVGAYYVEWSGYGRNYDVHNIPAHNLTHVYYGFAPICSSTENDSLKQISGSHAALLRSCNGREDFKVSIHDPWAALQETRPGYSFSTEYKGNFGQLMELKRAHPDLVILPSVGGWTLSDPFYSFSNATYRKRFVDSMEEYLSVWKFFDGVDIDWEFPGGYGANPRLGDPDVDRQTYHALMRELRAMLDKREIATGRKYHLTSAISAGSDKIARVDYRAVQQYMDHILLMTYDFYGGWTTQVLGHHTGLFAPAWNATDDYNVHQGLQAMLAQGVAPEKIALGVAMYGRGWRGVTAPSGSTELLAGTATGKYPPAAAKTKGVWEPGVQDYWGIAVDEAAARDTSNTTTPWTYHWDADAFAPYLHRSTDNAVISYDNARSVKAKGAYVRSKGLAGLFAWEIDADNGTILNAMHEGLGHGAAVANRAPIARAGPDRTVNSGANSVLDGSGSFDLDGDAVTLAWSQTSGTTVTLSSTTAERPTFTAPDSTTGESLVFTLTASDGTLTATDTTTITVRSQSGNTAPEADAGADKTVYTIAASTNVALDGSASSDTDGDLLTYAWTQTSGTTQTINGAAVAQASFSTAKVTATETLVFQLSVSDGIATDTDTVTITLEPAPANRPPVVTLDSTKTVTEGAQVTLTATAADPDGDAITWSWDTGTLTGVTGAATASITFSAPQVSANTDYTIVATATDDGTPSLSGTSTLTLTVADQSTSGCNTSDPNAGSYPAWESGKNYVKPNRVSHTSLVWEAKYWTSEEPKITKLTWPSDWILTSTGIEIEWNPGRAYNGGDETNLGDRRYRAKYWTQGDNPTSGGPWSDIGASTCAGNQTPVANAGADQSVTSGVTVTLDGSGSSDGDGDTLTYSWSHTGGTPAVTLTGATTASPTFAAPTVSTSSDLVFTLTVSDGTATDTDTVTITVTAATTNRAPVANAGADQTATSGATVSLAGSATDPDGDTVTLTWSQSASNSPQVVLAGGAQQGQVTFTAPTVTTATTFTFLLTASDGSLTHTDTMTVTVSPAASNQAPDANAGADQSVTAGAAVTLDGSGSSDSDGDTITYSWAHTSGTPAVTLSSPTTAGPTFTAPSVTSTTALVFTLTVSDGTATDSDTVTVTVSPGSTGGTCSRTDPAAGNYTAWSSSKANYVGGNQVSHNGLVWEARYWTTEEPAITKTSWPTTWKLLSATELKWHPGRTYVKDDEADHGTRRYRASWWTKGANPSTDTTGTWTDIGAATCPVDHY